MSRNVYVGNLPYRITEEELARFFGQEGREVVSAHLVFDRETGRPRGFGFVEFKTEAMAEAAVGAMDGRLMEGRPLKVSLARAREGGGPGGGGAGPPRRPWSPGGPPGAGGPRPGGPPPGGPRHGDRPPGDRPGGWAPRGDRPPGDRPGGTWQPRGPGAPGGGFGRPGGGFGRPGGGFGAPPAPPAGWGDERPQRTPGGRRRVEPDFDEERSRKAADWERKKGGRRRHQVDDDDFLDDDE